MSGTTYICAAELKKQRGVTETLIKKFFKGIEKLLPNPHNNRFPDMRVFDLKKVIEIEQTEECAGLLSLDS